MQLNHRQLPAHLQSNDLKCIYLISSDISLLKQETKDLLRNAFKNAGYTQRKTFIVTTGFDWYDLQQELNHFSLFDEKCLIEIDNPKAKFDNDALEVINDYLQKKPPNKNLLIVTDKLSSAQQNTKWYKLMDSHGVIVRLWPVTAQELPAWISNRFTQAGLRAERSAISLLAELTEGNLLATQQAIEKLRLLYHNQTITEKYITNVINDNARYSVFDLTNEILSGTPHRVKRILSGLRLTGTETTLVLWALARELRGLYELTDEHEKGKPIDTLLTAQWQSRRALLQKALKRFNTLQLATFLKWAQRIDLTIKGIRTGSAWDELESLSMSMASAR